jgi:hypothetical protein
MDSQQISLGSYLVFGVVVLILGMFGAAISAAVYTFGVNLFSPKIKIIKGEVLNLNVDKRSLEGKIIELDFCVVIKDNNNGRVRSIKISKEAFAQLNEKRKVFLNRKILLYFKYYFFGFSEKRFDHYEIA